MRARPRRRGLPKDDGLRSVIADNILDRQFTAEAPNQRWIADFTYIWTAEGWLYVAVVIDLFSRRVVGWSMSDTMTAQLVTDALMMAIFTWRRLMSQGALTAAAAGEEVVSASEYRALEAQIRELHRLLGKKAMENELLREAVSRAADPKKLLLRSTSLPGDGR